MTRPQPPKLAVATRSMERAKFDEQIAQKEAAQQVCLALPPASSQVILLCGFWLLDTCSVLSASGSEHGNGTGKMLSYVWPLIQAERIAAEQLKQEQEAKEIKAYRRTLQFKVNILESRPPSRRCVLWCKVLKSF